MKDFIEEHKDLISQIAHSYNVNASIHPEDHIFQFIVTNPVFPSKEAIDYYFKDGQNSAQILLNLITSLYPPTGNPIKLLEFASGYGTRNTSFIKSTSKFEYNRLRYTRRGYFLY